MHDHGNRGTILVWDLPLRVFHWTLAGSFAGAFVTGDSERWRDLHALLGYTVLALVAFRVLWGVVGTRYARFRALPVAPLRALAYLHSLVAGRAEHHVGHNPAGSIAIYLLLALAVATGFTGLAAFAEVGGEWLGEVHEGFAQAMLALVVVHIGGVVVGSLAHHENLATTMLTGRKRGEPGAGISQARPLVAAALLAALLGLWTGLIPTPGLEMQPGLTGVTARVPGAGHAGRDDD